jgi:phenylacetate-coenzyme A ligase PaaK-like adenylate-forming protein
VELEDYFRRPEAFRNRRTVSPAAARIEGPWNGKTRTVTLATWFQAKDAIHLDRPTCESLEQAKPEALAGSAEILGGVAQAIGEGRLRLKDLYGVVVVEGLQGPVLTEKVRSLFWRAFQAPVIRQLRGFEGELLAAECECRDGLHIHRRNCEWEVEPWTGRLIVTSFANLRHPVMRLRTRLTGELVEVRCGCGVESPRLGRMAVWSGRKEPQRAFAVAG